MEAVEDFCSELDELNETLDCTDKKLKQSKEFQNKLLANVFHEDKRQCIEDVAVIVREEDRLMVLVGKILEYSIGLDKKI